MVEIGDNAPDFVVPKAGGAVYNDIEEFRFADVIADGPTVLAFFPVAFTSGCTEEMCTFRDSMAMFDDLDAQVYGVSVDTPPALNVWIQQEELNFPMLSDTGHEVIRKYDVVKPDMYGLFESAERSIFVVDTDGIVTYKWVKESDEDVDFDALISEVRDAVADAAAD